MAKKKQTSLEKVRAKARLHRAWAHVYQSGLKSDSESTVKDIRKFKENDNKNIENIYRQLQRGKFEFKDVKGITIAKKDKSTRRPLALIPIDSRIVQRSILEVLQEHPAIKKYLDVPTSFGAIEKKGVPTAIKAATDAINNGGNYFIKSDIKEFFTKIKIDLVLEKLAADIKEKDFISFVKNAIKLEINVLPQFKKDAQYFNFDLHGTPQGCCLSPLFGNILLHDFNLQMNQGDIVCLRYLDDFIILAPNEKAANAAFKRALKALSQLGLSAYSPEEDGKKAEKGFTKSRFEYLGVQFDGDIIRPSKQNKEKLLNDIKSLVSRSLTLDEDVLAAGPEEDINMVSTLYKLNNKIKGWGNQYFYCNDKAFMGAIDIEINKVINNYLSGISTKRRMLTETKNGRVKIRRLYGIHLITDSKTAN